MRKKILPYEAETVAKYCHDTGADPTYVHKQIQEFGEHVLKWKPLTNIDGAAVLWVTRQGKTPPPTLIAGERCFVDERHWGEVEIHENPDGSLVALCKRHRTYVCKAKGHGPDGVWVIGEHGFSIRGKRPKQYEWFWFCEEHKPPARKDLKERRPQFRVLPYTPYGWKWEPQRGLLLKA